MEMVVVFYARKTTLSETQRVFESGEGDSEHECVEHARAKMVGSDFEHFYFAEAFKLTPQD